MANAKFVFTTTKLTSEGTYITNVSMTSRKIDPNTGRTYDGVIPTDNIYFTPKQIYTVNTTGLNLEYLYLRNDKELLKFQNPVYSYQRFYDTTTFVSGDSTGLLNDATVYEATFIIDGIDYAFSAAGSTLQTYGAVLTAIDTLLTGVAASSIEALPGEGKSHIKVALSDFGVIHTVDGGSTGGSLNLFESLGLTIDMPIHNPFNFLPLVNNGVLEDIERRGVNYMVIKSPSGSPTADLTVYCDEYSF